MITSGSGAPGPRALSLRELRALRRSAHREEADLSYVRRLLQGRIDILRAEAERRVRATARAGVPLTELLARILADGPARQRSSVRHVTCAPPAGTAYRRLAEQMLAEVGLSDPAALGDGELRAALARLAGRETELSRRRQELHRIADDCGAEIARRYREGEARVEDLLGCPGPGPGRENSVA